MLSKYYEKEMKRQQNITNTIGKKDSFWKFWKLVNLLKILKSANTLFWNMVFTIKGFLWMSVVNNQCFVIGCLSPPVNSIVFLMNRKYVTNFTQWTFMIVVLKKKSQGCAFPSETSVFLKKIGAQFNSPFMCSLILIAHMWWAVKTYVTYDNIQNIMGSVRFCQGKVC